MFDSKIGDYSIHTFGYGTDHDPELMTNLAEQKNGQFYYIEDLSRVDEAFIDFLGLLKSSVGYNAYARVSLCNESKSVASSFKKQSFGQVYGTGWMNQQQISRNKLINGGLGEQEKLIKIG